jgi:hypothetical protein
MNTLDTAVNLLAKRGTGPARERTLGLLDGLIQECRAAAGVWRDYEASPGAAGDQWSLVSWIGPARARQLHEINLAAKAQLLEIGRLAGPEAGRFMDLDDDLIEMAYRQLNPDETGPDAARAAVDQLEGRAAHLLELRTQLKAVKPKSKPKKASAKKAAPKKALKKKAPNKK